MLVTLMGMRLTRASKPTVAQKSQPITVLKEISGDTGCYDPRQNTYRSGFQLHRHVESGSAEKYIAADRR